jgi:hypothetical protein
LKHRTRAVVALLLVALAALTLAACGGGDNDGGSSGGGGGDTADARAILRDTFSGTDEIRSADVDLRVTIAAIDDGESFTIGLGGPFQTEDGRALPSFDMELDANLGAQGQFRAGIVSVDERLFVEWMGDAYEVPSQLLDQARTSLEQQADRQEGQSLEAYGIDAQSWVDDPEVVGQEDVGGTETDHVTGTLNVRAFLDSIDTLLAEVDRQGLADASGQDVPDRIPADDRADIERSIRDARVDVWSGTDDSILRKLQVGVEVAPQGGANDAEGGTIEFALQFDGVNEEQSIAAPTNTRPIDQLLGQFQGLLGGSGLGGSAGGAAGGDIDEYQDCLVRAAGDVEAAQRCASLLR